MYLLGQYVKLLMIERQRLDLATPVQVVIDILGTFDHHDLLAVLYFRLDDYLRVSVDYAIRSTKYLRLEIVLFLATEGDVFDGHEVVLGMDDPHSDENLIFIFVPILDLELVIYLLAVIDLLYKDISLIEDLDRITSLIPDDVMRDELQWLYFLLFEEVLLLFFFRLLLPACYSLVDTDEDFSR